MAYIKMQDILDEFSRHNKKVFSINDVARIIGKPKTYASKLLSHSRKVGRIERGKYYLRDFDGPDMYEIASQIVFPSYVSMFAAFQYYSITEQDIVRYSVVTIKRHRPVKIGDTVIEFVTFGRDRFFGYKKVGNLYIATVEKAIIDSLYMGSPPLSYVEEAFSAASRMGLVSKDVLMNTASRMRSKVTEKKVLELIGTSGIGDAPG